MLGFVLLLTSLLQIDAINECLVIISSTLTGHRRRMSLHARGGARRGFSSNRRGLLRGGSSHRGSRGGLMSSGSSHVFRLKRGLGVREGGGGRRGRGVRLRGGGSRMHRRGDDYDESDDDEDDDDDEDEDDEDEEEEEEEDSEEGGRGQRHRHRRRRRRADEDDEDDEDEDSEGRGFDPEDEEMDTLGEEEEEEEGAEHEEEGEGRWDSDPEPPVLLVSDLNDELLSGSYLTVTLQRPHKARRQAGKCNFTHLPHGVIRALAAEPTASAGSIVPKLEAAVGPRTPAGGAGGQQSFVQRKTALSKLARPRFDGVSHRGPGR